LKTAVARLRAADRRAGGHAVAWSPGLADALSIATSGPSPDEVISVTRGLTGVTALSGEPAAMDLAEADFASLSSLSREFVFAVDSGGTIRFADGRARRLLGLTPGDSLAQCLATGSEPKLAELLVRAHRQVVPSFELVFELGGRAHTVELAATPSHQGVVFLGHLIPEATSRALEHLSKMIGEVVELNRTVVAQRNELSERNRELSESNQGIQALLGELQDKSEQTHHDAEIKGRLVANLSHELRTPLHSILGLTDLLASGLDGKLASEQEKQVRYIRASADDLLTLVNDVLDISKLDANRSQLHVDTFDLRDFVSSMRGVLRPLLPQGSPVELVFEDAPEAGLETDRSKLSQIVRNLVSNALKFTERGEVRVAATSENGKLRIRVTDTGIGIAPADAEKIFEEYGQIDSPLQRRLKGTGLGLPLSKKLAGRLGGTLTLSSEPGKGSTFTLELPQLHEEAQEMRAMIERSQLKPADAASILVLEDDRHSLFLYEKYLVSAGFHVLPARTIADAKALMAKERPSAIVLDVMLEGDASWGFLAHLKKDEATRDIPVLVVTITNREDKARALGADEFWLKPIDQDRLLKKLRQLSQKSPMARVLVIDDDRTARYIIRRHLEGSPYQLFEAANRADGVQMAREQHPSVILLDFLLEGSTAFDVIDDLKADSRTRGIPIIVVTSQVLDERDQKRLLLEAEAVISKQTLSRELAINRIRDALKKSSAMVSR
jgi:signal transduction histidine kinase/DNA-binding response OmpR family regulator